MKRYLLYALAVAALMLVARGPLAAHHAASNFDKEHPITLTGVVTEYRFTNPHTQVLFDVKDENGNIANWVAEGPAPQELMRNKGWAKDSLKPGDQVTILGRPSKDGRKLLYIVKIEGPGGKEFHIRDANLKRFDFIQDHHEQYSFAV